MHKRSFRFLSSSLAGPLREAKAVEPLRKGKQNLTPPIVAKRLRKAVHPLIDGAVSCFTPFLNSGSSASCRHRSLGLIGFRCLRRPSVPPPCGLHVHSTVLLPMSSDLSSDFEFVCACLALLDLEPPRSRQRFNRCRSAFEYLFSVLCLCIDSGALPTDMLTRESLPTVVSIVSVFDRRYGQLEQRIRQVTGQRWRLTRFEVVSEWRLTRLGRG